MCVPLSFAEHHSGNEKRHPPFCPCLPRAIEKILWHTVVRNMALREGPSRGFLCYGCVRVV